MIGPHGAPFAAARAPMSNALSRPFATASSLRTPVDGREAAAQRGVSLRHAPRRRRAFRRCVVRLPFGSGPAPLEGPVRRGNAKSSAPFRYQRNEVLLHTDTRMLPRTPARAAWNYHALAPVRTVALTYDMNVLMSLDAPLNSWSR